ncbi:glycosyltransferase [Ramlibacter ginsenosidimutans]|uniref:Glycosyltransferase n=1 Tax=Ramlibacter ginsenosidimutans TaxID=502333 RepID=A0A934TPY8_9BURK|nr:glycosyltransferase family 2 protein [Ramlibacter ginsenosidimutans]MBK6005158.1 glycosyltransferase [Ramlibacter ginsenosidimutans]
MSMVLLSIAAAFIVAVALLVLVLLVEVVAGSGARHESRAVEDVPPYVVLVPAHDEAGTIQTTIAAVRAQLPASARLLVVADNCSDTTAAEARAAGAEVIERHDASLRGKGYALAFGVRHLHSAPPPVLVMLDADCIPASGALDLLAARAAATGRPVQALDLLSAHPGSRLSLRMASFAWALKNQLRPLGLHRLGLPCQLMGTGMAFPWDCIGNVELGSSHLTEDLQLGVKLAAAGRAAIFCREARVDSWFPQDGAAQRSQRKRWEHGHLAMIVSEALPLLLRGCRSGNAGAIALALDLCVPPLAFLALLVLVSCLASAWVLATGGPVLLVLLGFGTVLAFAAAVLLAWWRVGRSWVRWPELLSSPLYVMKKLPLYAGFVVRRQTEWVRTGRQR